MPSNATTPKTWLITGAGRGMGVDFAEAALAAGHNVVATGRNPDTVRAAVREHENLLVAALDITDERSAAQAVAAAVGRFGRIDVLVNNAGVFHMSDVVDMDEADFDRVLAVNVKGPFLVTRAVAPQMIARRSGVVVNIGSDLAVRGRGGHAAYTASKSGLLGFTRSLAIELAPRHVRVNAIGPGLIEVPRYFDFPGYTPERGGAMVPLGRVGHPRDIGPAVAFLCSDGAEFITGQTLYVDGGTNARMGLWWTLKEEATPNDP